MDIYTSNVFERLFAEQIRRFPAAQLTDMLKALHQCVFGCRHLNPDMAEQAICEELKSAPTNSCMIEIEWIGPCFCRIPLAYLKATGLSTATFSRIFQLSAAMPTGSAKDIETGLAVLLLMIEEKQLPFCYADAIIEIESWRKSGFEAPHHSDQLKSRYPVSYRVIHRDFLWILPLLIGIDHMMKTRGQGIVAIEGGSAAGKTTLSSLISRLYECSVYHMDDFFLRPFQRTQKRMAEPAGNIDWERFRSEVLTPTSQKRTVQLYAYDCHTQRMRQPKEMPYRPLTVVEGAYSMHPELAPYYDLSAFISVDPQLQWKRIKKRNTPKEQEMFLNQWIPLEQRYFNLTNITARCNIILEAHT